MNFENAKQRFEDLLRQMQRKLKKYAESDDASQKAVDIQTAQINTMIDFLNAADEHIESLRRLLIESNLAYGRLHHDAEKLVLLAEIHNVNPNMVFFYNKERLRQILRSGMRVIPPEKDFNKMQFHKAADNSWEYTYQEKELTDEQCEYANEYFTIRQIASKKRLSVYEQQYIRN